MLCNMSLIILFQCTMQVVQEAEPPLSKYYRHISKGAWPFSSRDHGWPISDCTSEGFKAALGLAALRQPGVVGQAISRGRLEEAVRVILSYQNSDGSMATYENTRSVHAMEVRLYTAFISYFTLCK
jgi:cycloartenol synthase